MSYSSADEIQNASTWGFPSTRNIRAIARQKNAINKFPNGVTLGVAKSAPENFSAAVSPDVRPANNAMQTNNLAKMLKMHHARFHISCDSLYETGWHNFGRMR